MTHPYRTASSLIEALPPPAPPERDAWIAIVVAVVLGAFAIDVGTGIARCIALGACACVFVGAARELAE